MGRRIVQKPDAESFDISSASPQYDDYLGRLVKYIPAEIVGAWIVASNLINSANDVPKDILLWIAFIVGTVLTAVWILSQTREPNKPVALTQTIVATLAFVVWIFALGGPFAALAFYRPLYGALLLIVFTLISGRIIPKEA